MRDSQIEVIERTKLTKPLGQVLYFDRVWRVDLVHDPFRFLWRSTEIPA